MDQIIGIVIFIGLFISMLIIVFIKANLVICQPNEVIIISGRKRKLSDGTVVGYRLIKGGRGFKFPILESVKRLPLTTIPIEVPDSTTAGRSRRQTGGNARKYCR